MKESDRPNGLSSGERQIAPGSGIKDGLLPRRLSHRTVIADTPEKEPDATIQAISGNLSRKMLEHYSHVRVEAKRRAVESLDAIGGQPVQ